jgi:hypothetical protein
MGGGGYTAPIVIGVLFSYSCARGHNILRESERAVSSDRFR